MGEVQVGLWVPTPSSWGMAQLHLRGTSPPPGGFASTGSYSASVVPRHPSTGSLGRRDCLVTAGDFALLLCVRVCVCSVRV